MAAESTQGSGVTLDASRPPKKHAFSRGVPISWTLALCLGGLVIAAVLSVLAISIWSGIRSTVDLLEDQAELALAMVETRIDEHLAPAKNQVRFVNDLIATGQLDPADDDRLRDILTGALAATPQVDGLVFLDPSLRFRAALRVGGGAFWVDEDRSLSGDMRALADAARGSRSAYWSDLIWSQEQEQTFLTLRQPVFVDEEFVGVLAAGVSVANLSAFVDRLDRQLEGGRTFILYDGSRVLAHPRLTEPLDTLSSSNPLPALDEVEDPILAAMWQPDRVEAIETTEARTYSIHQSDVDGEDWFYLYREISGYGDKPWIVGSYYRRQTIDQQFDRLFWAAVAGALVLGAAIGAALLIGRGIARPVERLAVTAQRIGALDFDRVGDLHSSRLRELNDAANAFNVMLGGLRWFESYVPRKLVRSLMGAGGDGRSLLSEEREVTVLFTDVVGFTSFAQSLPAGETAAFLNEHFALITSCVEAEGGTVDKFIGDSVMAFWGAPELQDDHAERACRAAREIAKNVQAENDRRLAVGRAPVSVRVGVHSGQAVVGNIGPPDRINYTIVGDTVNTCSRIESLGKTVCPGERDAAVLLSRDTRERLDGSFETVSVGVHTVRGRSEGVEVFRLT